MKRQQEIILILASMFIVSMAWIGLDIRHNIVTSTISAPLQQDILPIEPSFDTHVVQTLKQRHYSDPTYTLSAQQTTATPSGVIQQTSSGTVVNSVVGSPSAIQQITKPVTP